MFWRGVVGYLPVNIVQGLVGLLTIVTFTRLLSPSQFGDYALGFTVMSLVHTAVFTWNEAALARYWAGESDRDGGRDLAATVYRTWLVLLGRPGEVDEVVGATPDWLAASDWLGWVVAPRLAPPGTPAGVSFSFVPGNR